MAVDPLEQQRAELSRHAENAARPAMAYARFETTGQGTLEFEDRIEFGLTFIEEPYVSYGCRVDINDLAGQLDLDEDETPTLPQSTGFVTDWDTDDRGFFTGAWVAATVFDPTGAIGPEIDVVITHDFTFQAIGLKDIPLDVTD